MDGTQTVNLNQNAADCIKEVANLGNTVYANICSGVDTTVPWGVMNWIGFSVMSAFIGVIVLGLFTAITLWMVMLCLKAAGRDLP